MPQGLIAFALIGGVVGAAYHEIEAYRWRNANPKEHARQVAREEAGYSIRGSKFDLYSTRSPSSKRAQNARTSSALTGGLVNSIGPHSEPLDSPHRPATISCTVGAELILRKTDTVFK
jgi:hypothetical protein